jgi:hypothetical protein
MNNDGIQGRDCKTPQNLGSRFGRVWIDADRRAKSLISLTAVGSPCEFGSHLQKPAQHFGTMRPGSAPKSKE